MSNTKPQNYKNHARLDPAYHFFLVPVFFINIGVAVYHSVRHPGFVSFWLVLISIALFVLVGEFRVYSLRVQDRVIRLEERLRLAALVPEQQRTFIGELSAKQLVAVRFASDAEVVALAERAWREKLTPAQIKQAIQTWRPDTFRV